MSREKPLLISDYYNARQAIDVLSKNSGHQVNINYPRTLAKYGLIRYLDIGVRTKLYLKEDVDAYIVSTKRGRKKPEVAEA